MREIFWSVWDNQSFQKYCTTFMYSWWFSRYASSVKHIHVRCWCTASTCTSKTHTCACSIQQLIYHFTCSVVAVEQSSMSAWLCYILQSQLCTGRKIFLIQHSKEWTITLHRVLSTDIILTILLLYIQHHSSYSRCKSYVLQLEYVVPFRLFATAFPPTMYPACTIFIFPYWPSWNYQLPGSCTLLLWYLRIHPYYCQLVYTLEVMLQLYDKAVVLYLIHFTIPNIIIHMFHWSRPECATEQNHIPTKLRRPTD